MKKTIIVALIAATALVPPALAQERERRGQRAEARQEMRETRREARRDFRQDAQQRSSVARREALTRQAQNRDARQDRGNDRREYRSERREDRREYRQERREDRRDYRNDRRGDRRDYREDRRDDRRDYRNDNRREALTRQAQRRYNDWRDDARYRHDLNDRRDWARGWRNDRRYAWRDYRSRHRNVYRLPRYYPPRGYHYGYNRFSIGISLGSTLFAPNYWIEDPFFYRLPPAYGPYRWVRYYNDALLVDIRTGRVLDVEYDIFW